MKVRIPTPLRSYTGGAAVVEVLGSGAGAAGAGAGAAGAGGGAAGVGGGAAAGAAGAGGGAARATVADVLAALDERFPGIRFRVVDEQGHLRQHMMVWLDGERCRDLSAPVDHLDEVVIMQALSGG